MKTTSVRFGSLTAGLLLFVYFLNAQDYILDAQFYGIEEGISHRNVQCIHQDKRGFIWLGTDYGLNRFDGYHFKWFTKAEHGLLSNEVNHILEDKNGLLWLFDTGNSYDQKVNTLTIFDPVAYTFQSLEQKFGKNLPFAATDIIAFARNEKGYLAFITKNWQLITYTGDWNVVPIDLGQKNALIQLLWPPNGEIWVLLEDHTSAYTMLVTDEKGQIRQRLPHPSSHVFYVPELSGNSDGAYVQMLHSFIGASPHASFLHAGAKTADAEAGIKLYGNSATTSYNALCEAKSIESPSHFWMVVEGHQLIVLDKKSGVITPISDQYPILKNTNCLFLDKNQTVWVGTLFGIYHFQIQTSPFKLYLHNSRKDAGELSLCRQITRDNHNNLWVRVENPSAIWKINLVSNQAIDVGKRNGALPPLPSVEANNKAMLFTADHLIVYPDRGDIVRVNPATHRFSRISTKNETRIIWTLYEDRYGKIWFCDKITSEMGFFNGDGLTILPKKASEDGFIYVYQFLETADPDLVMLASNQGLFILNITTGELSEHYWSSGKGKSYFPFDNIHHLYPDPDGSYWAATSSEGIVHFKATPEGLKIIRQYTRTDGLSNNAVYAIYGDNYDNLWIATDYGINQFNKKTGVFRTYTVKDGISSNEFNRNAHFQDRDGTIYFGSMNGITAFHPRDFVGDTLHINAAMTISDFEQFDGRENKLMNKLGEILQSNTIVMRPDDRFFLLEFALLTFDETAESQFAYLVEDVDKDWTYQKENFIRLSRLPFGRHTLRIKGQNASGQWTDQELAIKVLVLKPFYLQTWFLLAVLSGLLAGAFVFYKWRVRSLKAQRDELERTVVERTRQISEDKKIIEQQAAELKSLEKLKSRFFANVSHELRTPLTLLLGPVNSLLKRLDRDNEVKKLLEYVQRNAQQLQQLINEILDLSKLEANKLEVVEAPVHFYPYLKDQMAQFHSAALSNELNFRLNFQADKSLTLLLDKSKFEKIVHNFLSNALKFTAKGGEVVLSVTETEGQFQLSVRDTGRGIHPDDLPHVFDRFYQSRRPDAPTEGGTGIGLSLVKELGELLGGTVWVESEPGQGSVFYFRFPVKTVETVDGGRSTVDGNPEKTGDLEILAAPEALRIVDRPPATILLVEDNADLREYLQFLLADYQVLAAENGQAALDMLEGASKAPDLIISDLMMPVMDGLQFLEKIKAEDRWRHLPVIMLTAKVNFSTKLNALRIGVDDYLTKPFQEDELKIRIENLLHNYRERMELFAKNNHDPQEANEPGRPVIAAVDAKWLAAVEQLMVKKLKDSAFNLDWVASEMHLSERQLRRKVQQLTGLSPNQYLQEMRLQTAKDLLFVGKYATVKEVGFAVGYRDTSYFSSLFAGRFGAMPSAYLR